MILDTCAEVEAFVLAGGASKRMGTDKAMLRLGGETLVERALRLLRSLGFSPKIVGSREDLSAFAPVVRDLRSGCGPLSGIEAALQNLSFGKKKAVFIPVDAPLLPPAFARQMLYRAYLTDAMVTLPRSLGQEQPLCAIYDRRLLPEISAALDAGDYKVTRVMKQAALAKGGPQSFDCYDIEVALAAAGDYADWPAMTHTLFLNCNTTTEFDTASAWLDRQEVQ